MRAVADGLVRGALTALLLASGPARAEVEARLAVASSYTHRGITYAASAPAWQGALEYRTGAWFAGIWGARLDVNDYRGQDERYLELDYYLGRGWQLSDQAAVEATLIRYTFHGRSPRGSGWTELQLSAYLGDRWTVTGGVAENWWGAGATTGFAEGTWRYPLPGRLVLDVTAGYQLAERAVGFDYGYAEAGISVGIHDVVLRLGRTLVAPRARERFAPMADQRWVASLTLMR